MESVVIIFNRNTPLADLHRKLSAVFHVTVGGDRLVVHENERHIYIDHHIESCCDRPPYQVDLEYSSIDLVKKVIATLANGPRTIVDNGFGTVRSGDEFVALMAAKPDWDWRREGLDTSFFPTP